MMQLYILGPAFGQPSIDAECIAAVVLLKLYAKEGEWSIIPTHDQTKRLPYLTTHRETIEGFRNIIRHLSYDINFLDEQQNADAIALSSFVESHASILLDISLYVAFENYTATRSAFTKILPWHANYIIPPARRSAARARTAHLGIGSIDMDDVHEDLSNRPAGLDAGKAPAFEAETQKRASLLLGGRKTIRSLLQQPEHTAVFKLHNLADNFFGPLEDMLGESKYFLGAETPGEVDCLVYGYLALMLFPQLPQDWLMKTMRSKHTRLTRFTKRMCQNLEMETNTDDVMALVKRKDSAEITSPGRAPATKLPWGKPQVSSNIEIASAITRDLISRIPLVSATATMIPSSSPKQSVWRRQMPSILGATASCLGLLGYYAFASGMILWPHGEEVHVFGRKRLSDYGHIGAALAGVSLLSQQAKYADAHRQQVDHGNPVMVEVEVEKDG